MGVLVEEVQMEAVVVEKSELVGESSAGTGGGSVAESQVVPAMETEVGYAACP